jgi:nitrite reductase/ring-hydroxylating ferredoxin subunit
MPRDGKLLTSMDKRVRVSHFGENRYPFPVPNGWFIVAEAGDIEPGGTRAVYYFGRDLVVFRGESGKPSVVDAHCPHLGAHLAVGGKVEGDCIRCPFHGWKFDGESGTCVEIPYGDSQRIPPRGHARSYPTIERNHMIWAWYHEREGEPFYDVPEVPELNSDDWSPIIVREFEVNVAAQDMAENNVDFAHFRYVHGAEAIPEDEFITEGTYKKAIGRGGDFVREGFGLGLGVVRMKGFVTFLSSTTPITADSVHVRWLFTSPASGGAELAQMAVDAFCDGVSQDIPIWENKRYRNPPIITKSEKLILEHRRWAEQFYCDAADRLEGDL